MLITKQPGNRNADNVDKLLEPYDYIVYPSRSIQTDGIKAFSVTSFGFGQKGAQVIGIHPRYLFATLSEPEFQTYKQKVSARQKKAYTYFHTGMINNTLFQAKTAAPYDNAQQSKVFLDPTSRVTFDKKTSELRYPVNGAKKSDPEAETTREMVSSLASATAKPGSKVGVDVESLDAIPIDNTAFLDRNFTPSEQAYCQKSPNAQASFAGRWAGKEAVFKSLGVSSKGGGAGMKEIEIVVLETGGPGVKVCNAEVGGSVGDVLI